MARMITDSQHYENIADAIRAKTGTSEVYKPAEMASAIGAISGGSGGGSLNTCTIEVPFGWEGIKCYYVEVVNGVPTVKTLYSFADALTNVLCNSVFFINSMDTLLFSSEFTHLFNQNRDYCYRTPTENGAVGIIHTNDT